MAALVAHGTFLLWMFALLDPVVCFQHSGEFGAGSKSGELQEIQHGTEGAALADDDWGESPSRAPEDHAQAIVGGESARIGTNPWQAALLMRNYPDQKPFCGGSLISNRHILTAGHCLFECCWYCLWCIRERRLEASELIVRLGAFDWTDLEEAEDFDVKKIILHEGYDGPADDDIAVLKLATKVNFGTHINIISLPRPQADYTGRTARVTGWGLLKHGGKQPDELQSVDVKIFDYEECRDEWEDNEETDNRICAGHNRRGKDFCHGDSGGPLSVENHRTGRRELVAVCEASDCGRPGRSRGRYMKVTYYLKWIERKMLL